MHTFLRSQAHAPANNTRIVREFEFRCTRFEVLAYRWMEQSVKPGVEVSSRFVSSVSEG